MKRIFVLVIVGVLVLSLTTPAYCDDMLKKFSRGVCNVLTCPIEFPEQIKRVHMSDGPLASATWGVTKGIGMMLVRCVVGVYEVVTFPIPYPEDYKPIMKDPEFFFEQSMW